MKTSGAHCIKLLAITMLLLMMGCGSQSAIPLEKTSKPTLSAYTITISSGITPTAPAPSLQTPAPSSHTTAQPPGTSPQPLITINKEVTVLVNSLGYTPSLIYAPVGTIVIWQSSEPRFQGCCPRCHINHGVTSETDIFNGLLSTGSVFAHYFGTVGTYVYYDSLHPELRGTIFIGTATGATQSGPAPVKTLPGTGGLAGSVIFADNTPASGDTVWLFPSNNRNTAYASAIIGTDGGYTFSNVQPGSYLIYFTMFKDNTPIFLLLFKEALPVSGNNVTAAGKITIPRP